MSGGGNGTGPGDADDVGDGSTHGDEGDGPNDEASGANDREGRRSDGEGSQSDGGGRRNNGEARRNDWAGGPSGGVEQLSRYFDALADERRRHALYYLRQHGTASLDELARHAVVRETGHPPDERSDDEYERVKSELHHKHLPRLADYGLVEFDPRSEQVRYREPTRLFSTLVWLSRLLEGRDETET